MVGIVVSQNTYIDRLLWVVALAALIGGIGGYYYFADKAILLRVAGLLALCAVAFVVAFQTRLGKKAWELWLESIQEVRKMYWPTRQETIQATIAVLAMVVVIGVVLWSADFILLRAVGWITGHWS